GGQNAGKTTTVKGSSSGRAAAGPGGSTAAQTGSAASGTGTVAAAPVPTRTSLADGPPATVPFRSASANRLLGVLAVGLLVIVLFAPPTLILWLGRRSKEGAGC